MTESAACSRHISSGEPCASSAMISTIRSAVTSGSEIRLATNRRTKLSTAYAPNLKRRRRHCILGSSRSARSHRWARISNQVGSVPRLQRLIVTSRGYSLQPSAQHLVELCRSPTSLLRSKRLAVAIGSSDSFRRPQAFIAQPAQALLFPRAIAAALTLEHSDRLSGAHAQHGSDQFVPSTTLAWSRELTFDFSELASYGTHVVHPC